MISFPYRRIVIVGTSGSGKSTLSKQLAHSLNIPHIELDRHYWNPGWVSKTYEELRRSIDPLTQEESWIVDGNYSKLHDLTWSRAQCLIWLEYPLPLVLYRLARRTLINCLKKRELCNGNHESVFLQLCTRHSIFLFAIQSHRRRKSQILTRLKGYPHLALIHLNSPKKAGLFVEDITNTIIESF